MPSGCCKAGHSIVAGFAQGQPVLTDGGKRRVGVSRHRQVVKTDNAHILRDPDSSLLTFRYGGNSPDVMGAEDGISGDTGFHRSRAGTRIGKDLTLEKCLENICVSKEKI